MKTAEVQQLPKTSGLLLHKAAQYDLLLWLLTLGRERNFRERALGLARLSAGEAVLDIGCGTGTLAIAAKRQVGPNGRVDGIDASSEMIRRASRKASKAGADVAFQTALVESLPFCDGTFDVVLSTLMLHHLPGVLRSQCAAQVRRVLKPGGRLLAIDFGTSPGEKGIVAHFHRHGHINLSEMTAIFRGAGLQISESGTVGIGDLEYLLAVSPCCDTSAEQGAQ
ncbi:class I SAM-dependent methyltransferase [Terriglobus sp. 2YAB30_2]|uniref:class I SAM-dependent methyltransferase n=1 Tax=unclassified Terriglobus TaxID=2628988 RepID=UPI003F980A56